MNRPRVLSVTSYIETCEIREYERFEQTARLATKMTFAFAVMLPRML